MINFKFTFPDDSVRIIQARSKDTAIRIMNKKMIEKNEIENFCMFETANPTEFIFVKYHQTA
jgi:predicted component of type VI protein secretion system